MQIIETKNIDIIYMAELKELSNFYQESEEWTLRHIIAVMHNKYCGSGLSWETKNENNINKT